MSTKTVVGLAGVVAGIGAAVAKQMPELQRYLKVRKM
jgi:hypothetical protein